MSTPKPSLPLPPPLRGAETGTFAHDTVARRMPAIAARVIAENDFPPEIVAAIEELVRDMPHGLLRPLRDRHAPDANLWDAYLAPYVGQSWLDAPWFVAETYMFRRILEATGFFGAGPGAGADPYALQKRRGLELARGDQGRMTKDQSVVTGSAAPVASVSGDSLSSSVLGLSSSVLGLSSSVPRLSSLVHGALWGNQADLSLWPAEQGGRPQGDAAPRAERLLRDDAPALAEHIVSLAGGRADIVLDNGGHELLADLALAEALLELDITVVLHAKPHPTYVSDVTLLDLDITLAWLLDHPATAAHGRYLLDARESGRLVARADWFWTSALACWEMPGALRQELAGSGLIISKGDANYRRWLGDRHWPFDAPLDGALSYAPAPLALLRTCKSDVAAGLDPARMAGAAAQDAEWLTAGRWGVVQFVRGLRLEA